MKILDRYVLFTFIKNYLISLLALLGLYVVLDMVFSFDELAEVQQKSQLIGTVSGLATAGEQMRGTITLRHDDTAAVGTEFKISAADGKTVATLTVESAAG